MDLDRSEKKLVQEVLGRYSQDFRYAFQNLMSSVTLNEDPFAPRIHLSEPQRLKSFFEDLDAAIRDIRELPDEGGSVPDSHASLIREGLVSERLTVARRVEAHKARTLDPELVVQIEAQLAPYDSIMKRTWLRAAPALEVPQMRDYFPLHLIEHGSQQQRAPERALDEKFHILQAPSLFQGDLHVARSSGKLRGISCAVAYLDIDDFKRVNSTYGEPFVDLNILPKVMRALEAHVHRRGRAYRFGGDEYGLLLYNTSSDEAAGSLERLRKVIEALQFIGTGDQLCITLSMGFILVAPGCHLTDREVESFAANAKQEAKRGGKNCVATFDPPWFESARVLTHLPS